MNIKPIKSDVDYQKALKRLEVIFDAAIGTQESDEADVLAFAPVLSFCNIPLCDPAG